MRNTTIAVLSLALVGLIAPTSRAADNEPEAPGPIDTLGDLQDTAKMLFKLADSNNDGLISQQEAVDVGNLLVGGFFFRADQNGDGKVTKEESDQARENLFKQRPLLRFVFERAQQEAATQGKPNPAEQVRQNVLSVLDSNQDGAIEAAELRQGVQSTVQSLFLAADRSGDGQLDPNELNIAVVEVGRTALQAGFKMADTDNSGAISRDEFNKALVEPANVVFRVFDANNDGQITPEEMNSGVQIIGRELNALKVREPNQTLPERIQQAVQGAPTRDANAVPAAGTAPAPRPAPGAATPAPAPAPAPQPAQPR